MPMAKKVKAFQVILNGKGFPTMVKKAKLPKLANKSEDFRADIMDMPVAVYLGKEKMEAAITWEEFVGDVLKQWGACEDGLVRLRLVASVESEECTFSQVEIVLWGTWRDVEFDDLEQGSDTTMTSTMDVRHFEYIKDGEELIFVDALSGVLRTGGVDRTAQRRKNIGLEY